MAAYVIHIRNHTTDASHFETYHPLTAKVRTDNIEVITKGGLVEALEGAPAETVVILRFASKEEAHAWYDSDEYQAARPHRLRAADYRTLLVSED